jgi:hypothetical protein
MKICYLNSAKNFSILLHEILMQNQTYKFLDLNSIFSNLLVKDLCKTKCPPRDKHGKCTQSVPIWNREKKWHTPVICGCETNYTISSDETQCSGIDYHRISITSPTVNSTTN